MIHFCHDQKIHDRLGYPNLAVKDLRPDDFDITWPRVTPFRLTVYLNFAGIDYQVHDTMDAPQNSWYPIGIGWFDFACDYFGLMPTDSLQRLRNGDIRALFYYHEGDNPKDIKRRLDDLCAKHNLPLDCYRFITANSAGGSLDNFWYFNDHEYFFRYINRRQHHDGRELQHRARDFLVLNRTHKWWRATCMADLQNQGLLDNSLWSYNTDCLIDDRQEDNPIEIDSFPGLRKQIDDFINQGPYACDDQDATFHNDHRRIDTDLYYNTNVSLVLETHFDADGSGGAFLTEKTFKCIKYAQPFVIIGTPGSIDILKQQGYHTFDHIIDHSYDQIQNNTDRWRALRQEINRLKSIGTQKVFDACVADLEHNQKIFADWKTSALIDLVSKLT